MHIMRYFFNSFKVAGISVVLSIIMISMSAYVVARMNFKFKSVVSVMLMSTLFIPPTAMTFPVYNLINSMGINDTHAGLILIYTCSGIASQLYGHQKLFPDDTGRAGRSSAY